MEQDVKEKFNEIESQIKFTNNKLDKVENRVYSVESSIAIINTNTSTIVTAIDEIKQDIKELRKARENDHFVKPLNNMEKLKYQVFNLLIGIFIGGFLFYLFPMLK